VTRFIPNSRWVKYDPSTKKWLQSRKRVYLYWYKFLQHAEKDPDYKVQWKKYEGWGGANTVLGMKFDDWWNDRLVELFSIDKEGDNPKFQLSTKQIKTDSIRYALLVFENRHRGSNWDIVQYLAKKERSGRGYYQDGFKEEKDLTQWGFQEDQEAGNKRRDSGRKVGRYKQQARRILNNVSNGQFP
jgi:hypothetical protein